MARFRFRLARVARVREIEEESARAQWAAAESLAARAEAALEAARESATAARLELAQLQSAPRLDPAAVMRAHGLVQRLLARVKLAKEAWRQARIRADQQMALWRERDRDRKALDKLEERAHERFLAEEQALESAKADEVALQRALRPARTGSSPEGFSVEEGSAS